MDHDYCFSKLLLKHPNSVRQLLRIGYFKNFVNKLHVKTELPPLPVYIYLEKIELSDIHWMKAEFNFCIVVKNGVFELFDEHDKRH